MKDKLYGCSDNTCGKVLITCNGCRRSAIYEIPIAGFAFLARGCTVADSDNTELATAAQSVDFVRAISR